MLLDALGESLLGNIFAGKGANRAGEGIVKAGYGNKKFWKTATTTTTTTTTTTN